MDMRDITPTSLALSNSWQTLTRFLVTHRMLLGSQNGPRLARFRAGGEKKEKRKRVRHDWPDSHCRCPTLISDHISLSPSFKSISRGDRYRVVSQHKLLLFFDWNIGPQSFAQLSRKNFKTLCRTARQRNFTTIVPIVKPADIASNIGANKYSYYCNRQNFVFIVSQW